MATAPSKSTAPDNANVALKESLEELGKLTECAICHDHYTDPKALSCQHVYCKQCLQELIIRQRRPQTIECPQCRVITQVKGNDAGTLPTDFFVNNLMDTYIRIKEAVKKGEIKCEICKEDRKEAESFCCQCQQYMCVTCAEVHQRFTSCTRHQVVPQRDAYMYATRCVRPSTAPPALTCTKHEGKLLELYCLECQELICRDCVRGEHDKHKNNFANIVAPEVKEEVQTSLASLQRMCDSLSGAVARVSECIAGLRTHKACAIRSIECSFEQLKAIIAKHQESLLTQTQQLAQNKLAKFSEQEGRLKLALATTRSFISFVDATNKGGSDEEFLSMKKQISARIQQLGEEFKDIELQPSETINIAVQLPSSAKIEELCRQSSVVFTISPDTTETVEVVNRDIELFVGTSSDQGLVTATLKSHFDGSTSSITVKKETTAPIHHLSFQQPQIRGLHELHVKVNDTDISGSPLKLFVHPPPVTQLGRPVKTILGVTNPWGVAVNRHGEVHVMGCNHSIKKISVFDFKGERVRTIDQSYGGCCGTAIDNEDNVYVTTCSHHLIKFSRNGKQIKCVGGEGSNEAEFKCPRGVAIHGKHLYVCDQVNHRIQVFDLELAFIRSFGGEGAGEKQFIYPYDISFDESGNMYIAESGNKRVQVLDPKGQFLRQFTDYNNGEMKLTSPLGVHVANGYVFVSDNSNHCIVVFRSVSGEFVTSFGELGKLGGQFCNPRGITTDCHGFLYVCDYSNERVQIF